MKVMSEVRRPRDRAPYFKPKLRASSLLQSRRLAPKDCVLVLLFASCVGVLALAFDISLPSLYPELLSDDNMRNVTLARRVAVFFTASDFDPRPD